jgi:hypothetical protein
MSARKQTPEFQRGTVSPSSGSSSPRELLGLFEGGIALLQNVGKHVPVYIIQLQRRIETQQKWCENVKFHNLSFCFIVSIIIFHFSAI